MISKSIAIRYLITAIIAASAVSALPKTSTGRSTSASRIFGNIWRDVGIIRKAGQDVIRNVYNHVVHGAEKVTQNVVKLWKLGRGFVRVFKRTVASIRFGATLISPPGKAIEYKIKSLYDLQKTGLNLVKKIPEGETPVKAWDYEKRDVFVIGYASGAVSVISKSTDATVHLPFYGRHLIDRLKAAFGWSILTAVQLVVGVFREVMLAIGGCWRFDGASIDLDKDGVNELEFSQAKICGLDTLVAVYSVHLSRNDTHFLILEMPYKVPRKLFHLDNVTVPGYLENEPVGIILNNIEAKAKITFRSGTIMDLLHFHLRIVEIGEMEFLFQNKNTTAMIDPNKLAVGGVLKDLMNSKLDDVKSLMDLTLRGSKRKLSITMKPSRGPQ